MFASILSEAKGLVDKRFLLNGFFPCLVFLGAGGLLVASANGGVDLWVERWDDTSGTVQLLLLAGAVAVVFAVAAFVLNAELLLIRLYEGYVPLGPLRRLLVQRQEAHKSRTKADRHLFFPQEGLQATALGNVLAAAEGYPRRAYGVNSLAVWPRLFLLLPEEELTAAGAARDSMHFLLLVSFLSWSLALFGGSYAAVESLGAVVYLVVVLGGGVAGWLAYESAVQAAVNYGLYVRGAFDLHRNDLLAKLRRPFPSTADEEHRLWGIVSEVLRTGEKQPVRYVDPPPTE